MTTTDLTKVFSVPPPPTYGTHDHQPDPALIDKIRHNVEPDHSARAYAVYLAVLLIGQRTPEELVILANYLQTGEIKSV